MDIEKLSRRDFLTLVASATGLVACSEIPTPSPPHSPVPYGPLYTPGPARVVTTAPAVATATVAAKNPESLRERALKTIDNSLLAEVVEQLPNSLYRQYIESMGLVFFRPNTPSQVAFGNISMPLYPARIETERGGSIVHGEATLRKFKEQKAFTTTQAQTLSVPLPFILEGNGLLKTEVTLAGNLAVVSGLSPRILIRYPQDEDIDARLKPILPDILILTMVKEVATIGVMSNYLQIMSSLMSINNSRYKVQTKEAGEVEALSHVYANITHQIGRLAVLLDWAPFVLMVKAVSSQKPALAAMRSFSNLTQPIDAILATDFGINLGELLPNTFAWCIRNRKLMEPVAHIGNFDIISPVN